ncbi:MAG: ATP-dependent Clp protease ATP-binding subunit, partial [Chloroflexota bacterium]|nr:ATP-dependent Clp protease ATP-binding subunit [Chloroflexota bacterium]
YEEGGQLTEAIRRRSYSVVLLDEIEKAHPEVFNILLQILEDGRLTDAKGRAVDFRNTIIIMTSNVGAQQIVKGVTLGFQPSRQDEQKTFAERYAGMKDKVMDEMKKTFKPEFLNRIDATIVFHALSQPQVFQICDIQLARIQKQLTQQEIAISVTDAAKRLLVEKGYDVNFGARPLRRVIQDMVEDALSHGLLEGRFKKGDRVKIDAEGGELVMETEAPAQLAGASSS